MHDYLEKFLLGQLNLDLLGDNTREKMMADQIIENGLRNKLDEIWGCEATLYYSHEIGRWELDWNVTNESIQPYFTTLESAEKACNMLNSGEGEGLITSSHRGTVDDQFGLRRC